MSEAGTPDEASRSGGPDFVSLAFYSLLSRRMAFEREGKGALEFELFLKSIFTSSTDPEGING